MGCSQYHSASSLSTLLENYETDAFSHLFEMGRGDVDGRCSPESSGVCAAIRSGDGDGVEGNLFLLGVLSNISIIIWTLALNVKTTGVDDKNAFDVGVVIPMDATLKDLFKVSKRGVVGKMGLSWASLLIQLELASWPVYIEALTSTSSADGTRGYPFWISYPSSLRVGRMFRAHWGSPSFV